MEFMELVEFVALRALLVAGIIAGLIVIGTGAFMLGGVKAVLIVQWIMVIAFFAVIFSCVS